MFSISQWITPREKYKDFESLAGVDRVPERKAIKTINRLSGGGKGQNALLLGNSPIVYMMPHNDGEPTCPFVWYQRNGGYVEILNNRDDFTQIQNLPSIIDKITDVMGESYDRRRPIDPFLSFAIRLVDEVRPEYSGNGELVLLTGNFLNDRARTDRDGASAHFANNFLDMFIGWNFGDIVRDTEELEAKLLDLNQKLIKDGKRIKEYPRNFELSFRGKWDECVDCFYMFPRE